MARPTFKGTCSFCKQTFSKSAMTRHLEACETREFWGTVGKRPARTERIVHLLVEATGLPAYWLHLEASAEHTLAELDFYLRKTWLECCGHLSQFLIGGRSYTVSPAAVQFSDGEDERDMNVPLGDVLQSGQTLHYEYDFGTTTVLTVKVLAERNELLHDNFIRILARNDPPDIRCSECDRAAEQVCVECSEDPDHGWLCAACAEKHGCGEELLLPVVNSPRVGLCAYTGEA